jgi:peptide deformylase
VAILEILKFPDPNLRKKCKAVDKVTDEMVAYAKDMLETMYSFRGIGLAAAQVNRQIRLVVIDTRRPEGDEKKVRDELGEESELEKSIPQPLILFNPVVKKKDGKITYNEGCLSVPTYFEVVERAKTIEVEALNEKGEKVNFKTDGLLAICIQHEIDHLDGKLFIDRLSPIKSTRIKAKIRKYGYSESQDEEDDEQEDATGSEHRL